MKRAVQFSAVAGLLLCPTLLFAQPPGRGGPPGMHGGGPPPEMIIELFTKADANSDGSVTRAELMAVLQNGGPDARRGRGGPPPGREDFQRGQGQRPEADQGPRARRDERGRDGDRGGRGEQAGHGEQARHAERGPRGDQGRPQGPPPKPGQVMPEPVAQSLNLNNEQTQQLTALQADVDKRLADILTDEQQEQMKNDRPPHGPDHAGRGEGNQRPNRPQRPE